MINVGELILPTHSHSGLSQPLVVLPDENRKGRKPYWYRELMSWAYALRKDFPCPHDAYVQIKTIPYKLGESEGSYRCAGDECHGNCEYIPSQNLYLITLARVEQRCFVPFMIATLRHEWAHLLVGLHGRKAHTTAFWKQYGKIYEEYIDKPKGKSIDKTATS